MGPGIAGTSIMMRAAGVAALEQAKSLAEEEVSQASCGRNRVGVAFPLSEEMS